MHLFIETWQLENWKIVVPEFNRCIEYEPTLLCLLAKFDSSNDMVKESLLLLCELDFLFRSELTLVLVVFECDKLTMADLDFLIK